MEETTESIWKRLVASNLQAITGGLVDNFKLRNADEQTKKDAGRAAAKTAFLLHLAGILKDFALADAVFYDDGFLTFRNVPLEADTDYTVFIYVDLVASAKGLTSFTYADFYYHEPLIDLIAKWRLPDGKRGLWLNDVFVGFK